jgi:hypothetical protein
MLVQLSYKLSCVCASVEIQKMVHAYIYNIFKMIELDKIIWYKHK